MTSAPPKITQFYQTYMMEMGFDAHLRCVTVGRHSTMWIGPDEETITEGTNKYKIMPDGSLVIHDLDFNDMGVYVCVAKNQFGHDMAETFVYPVAVSQPHGSFRWFIVQILTWLWLVLSGHCKKGFLSFKRLTNDFPLSADVLGLLMKI